MRKRSGPKGETLRSNDDRPDPIQHSAILARRSPGTKRLLGSLPIFDAIGTRVRFGSQHKVSQLHNRPERGYLIKWASRIIPSSAVNGFTSS